MGSGWWLGKVPSDSQNSGVTSAPSPWSVLTAMTLGLVSIVINAALLLLGTGVAYELFGVAFTIAGFPTAGLSIDVLVSALVAAVVLSIISTIVGLVVHD